ncbi:MAG: hypothetical protein JO336_08180 [Acidobacteriia bacterium]|nr:hypothetical protein [Terriglobia bacterium]MBV8905202.1 hypothetical protein [Terriglobia bacterium]MBV9745024.1 hypothetical protein [Terriglobia bacterium]
MPVSWEIRDRVLIVTLAEACGEEATPAITAAMADPAFQFDTSLLLDVRLCTDYPSSEEFRRWAISLASRRDRGFSGRCAFVIGPRPIAYGLARMASAYAELQGMRIEIFTDFEQAVQWLNRIGEAGGNTA